VSVAPLLSLGEETTVAWRCAQDALSLLRRRHAWPLLGIVVAGRVAAVALVAAYPGGPLAGVVRSLLVAIGNEAALHYPDAYAALPRVLATLDPLLGLLLVTPGLALVAGALPALLSGRGRSPTVLFRAGARIPAATAAAAPLALVAAVVPRIADGVSSTLFGAVGLLASAAVAVAALALGGLFAYALPLAVLGGASPLAAWARSVGLAARFPRVTLATLGLEALLVSRLHPAPDEVAGLFETLDPEAVPWLLGLAAPALALVEALRVATLARLLLHAQGTEAR
jgi:hypothetical protein